MSIREQKGREIASKARITQSGNLWLVPSQSGKGKYKVDAERQRCTCADYDFRKQKCKHIFAVEHTIEKTKTTVTENGKTTVTETVKVTRKTYSQVWPAYNKAQTREKAGFQYLLHQLCKGIGEPSQVNGRPRLPLEDMIFSMAFKVFSTVSARRFMSDLTDSHAKGYVSKLPCYNSVINYFDMEMLTPYLQMLIEESSLPLRSIENDFAVDSSGFSTCRFVQWMHAKYSDPHLIDKKDWLKVHLCCGTKTNVVTAVEISNRYAGDSPYFAPLVERTAENFSMFAVSADKAYLSSKNMQAAVDVHAMPYIPFKANSRTNDKRHSPLWKQMYHYFSFNTERFMQQYHRRSNVESTFMMIKAKFGDALRSRTERAQINEILCKILCHNICCLIQSMFELNLQPKFWAQVA
ncbi:MAG: transposase [Pyrinomonadaceae bacterium]